MLYPLIIIIIIRQENRLKTNYGREPEHVRERERANERESAPCEMLYLYVRESVTWCISELNSDRKLKIYIRRRAEWQGVPWVQSATHTEDMGKNATQTYSKW